jgi:hypothetical protein
VTKFALELERGTFSHLRSVSTRIFAMFSQQRPLSIRLKLSLLVACFGMGLCLLLGPKPVFADTFHVTPAKVLLNDNFALANLIVTQADARGEFSDRSDDLTTTARYASSNAAVVTVTKAGMLRPTGNGNAEITVTVDGNSNNVPVTVDGFQSRPEVGFLKLVMPMMTKAGCNTGACHGLQSGKGGFKLSVFESSPQQDHGVMVRAHQQRRINLLVPQESLILQKPLQQIAHGGGKRLERGSIAHEVFLGWIRNGAPGPENDHAVVSKLIVTPPRRVMNNVGTHPNQQLRVEAVYEDDTVRDVTDWAKFDSIDKAILDVSKSGLVTANPDGRGQAAVMVRFGGQVEISMFVVPYSNSAPLRDWKNNNFIDELAAAKFKEMGIEPSPLCDDATFLRRAYLDSIGKLPSVEETLAFLESDDSNKREKLIDRLLGLTNDPKLDTYNDLYAAYWSLKWSDLLRNTSKIDLNTNAMWCLYNWLKDSFRTNKPYDQFVSEILTAQGSIYRNGPSNFYRINETTIDRTESSAQLFMGLRMRCAQCHHHPFEKISQDSYYELGAFFARIGKKETDEFLGSRVEEVIYSRQSGFVYHPRTNKRMEPRTFDGELRVHPIDARIPLAQWLTSPKNKYFAKSIVNRYLSYLLGRGLVMPVDDMRGTNPPTNVALMNALADDFVKNKFDVKHLMRTIMMSRLYQLDSQPTKQNAIDRQFYSHYMVKRLPAEPLLDAINTASGTTTTFKNFPIGTRAIELADTMSSRGVDNYFLKTFAKPERKTVCECERVPDPSLAQALHTLNGDTIKDKAADENGRIAKMMGAKKTHAEIVTELYLATLSRFPTDAERAACARFLTDSPSPTECYEDLLWALMNSTGFLFVR